MTTTPGKHGAVPSGRMGAAAMMIGAACSYGVVSSILKLSYAHGLGPRDMTVAQYAAACVLLWGMSVLAWRRVLRASSRPRQWRLLTAIGLTGTVTSFAYYYSLTTLPASLAIVLLFQFTWMVPTMDMITHRRWLTRMEWMGLTFIVVGTFLAVGIGGDALAHITARGVLYGLLSGLGYGTQLYLSGYVDAQSSPTLRSAFIITASFAGAVLFVALTGTFFVRLSPAILGWGFVGALFAQVVPMLLMSVSIPRIGGRMASVLGAAELPAAVLFARLLLKESVSLEQWVGIVSIIGGIAVSELKGLKPPGHRTGGIDGHAPT